MNAPKTLLVRDVCELAHCNEKTAEKMARDGELKARKIRGRWLFNERDVMQKFGLLEEGE
ncbi:MAG: helix-turn-helix domain-containing protein [Coriobacteriales bacterium]|jgi:excisionase family DNA binding protein